MIAAEARASGLPMLLPDSGAAAEHLVKGAGHHYLSASAVSLALTIKRIADEGVAAHRAVARDAAPDTRLMDTHFEDLFRLYGNAGERSFQISNPPRYVPQSHRRPPRAVGIQTRSGGAWRSSRPL
jgi:alpha-1,6-mannosyltransferase